MRFLVLLLAVSSLGATWEVSIDPALPVATVRSALYTWEALADVHFVPATSPRSRPLRIVRAWPLQRGRVGEWRAAENIIRVRPDITDPDEIRRIVIHELGHHLGLVHCGNPECIMFHQMGGRILCPQERQQVAHRFGPSAPAAPQLVEVRMPSRAVRRQGTISSVDAALPARTAR